MKPFRTARLLPVLLATWTGNAADWPQFRGPSSQGVAAPDARPPRVPNLQSNLSWQVPVPPGNASPVLRHGRIFLTGATRDGLQTLALDANTGTPIWSRFLQPTRLEEVHRTLGSPASATVATDEAALYAYFGSFGLISYTPDGQERWRHPLPLTETEYGASSSPVLAGDKVIQLVDQDGGSYLIALDAATGRQAWRVERPEMRRGFGTPILWNHAGRTDLVVPGTLFMTGFDPASGTERWRVPGLARITCTTPVAIGSTLFAASWTTGGDRAADRIELAGFDPILKDHDRDGDGRLSYAELPPGAASERRKHLDGNRDGFVDRAEWTSMAAIFSNVENQAWALDATPEGQVTAAGIRWRFKRGLPYVASPLVHEGLVYLVKNGGFLTCLDARTGKPNYQEERLGAAGDYYASPVWADGHLYVASQRGVLHVLKAGPVFTPVSSIDFAAPIHATPAVVNDTLFVRAGTNLFAFRDPARR